MRRRTFLGAAAAVLGRAADAGPIIDTHTHFYDPTRPEGVPWPSKEETALYRPVLPPEYAKLTKSLGVTGVVVIEASPWLEDNQWLLNLAKRFQVIIGVVGHLDPVDSGFAAHLDHFARDPIFRGIRLGRFPASDTKFIEGLKRLAAAGLEVDALGGPEMLGDLIGVTDRVPDLRVVIDHLPYGEPQEPAARQAFHKTLRELAQRKQVYAKVSSVVYRQNGAGPSGLHDRRGAVDELWQLFGEDRLLYGSNWPVSNLAAPYGDVLRVMQEYFAAKGRTAAEKYFRKNSIAAYRCKAPSKSA